MAKQVKHSGRAKVESLQVGQRTNVQWYNLHGFNERNSRHDSLGDVFSDLKDQIRPLAEGETDDSRRTTNDGLVAKLFHGWDELQAAYIEVTLPTDAEIKLAVQQRQEKLAAWRGDRDENMGRVANFAERFWFPSGEPCPILGIVNMSYRRLSVIPAVVYARNQRGVDTTGQFALPVFVREYADKLAAYMRHVDENLGKDAGRKDYTPLDYLRIAADIHKLGGNEAALRKYGNVGESQRAFRFVKLDSRFPDVKLIERAFTAPMSLVDGKAIYFPSGKSIDATTGELAENPDSIGSPLPYRSLDKEDLQGLLSDKKMPHKPLKTAETQVCTNANLERFVEYVTNGGSRATSWNKKDCEGMMSHKSEVLRFLGWAMSNAKRAAIGQAVSPSSGEATGLDLYAEAIDKAAKVAGFNYDDLKNQYGK
jgi:hypothetical protein